MVHLSIHSVRITRSSKGSLSHPNSFNDLSLSTSKNPYHTVSKTVGMYKPHTFPITLFSVIVIRINPKDRIFCIEGLLSINFPDDSFHMSDQNKIEKQQPWTFLFSCCYSLLNKLWCQKNYYFPSAREIWTIIRIIKALWQPSKLKLVQQWNCKGIEQGCLPRCFNCLITVCSQRPRRNNCQQQTV